MGRPHSADLAIANEITRRNHSARHSRPITNQFQRRDHRPPGGILDPAPGNPHFSRALGHSREGTDMERKKASDFPQELLDLFDGYVHGGISRRDFLDRAQKFAVGGVTAAALFQMLKPNYAWAIQVPADDKRIKAEYDTVPSPQGNGSIKGYLVRPANAAKLPCGPGHPRESRPQSLHRRRGATAGGRPISSPSRPMG